MSSFSPSTKKIIYIVIAICMFMDVLDASVLNTALPQIAFSLHQNPINLKVAITTYLLTLGIFLPASGWLADTIGEKRTLTLAIFIFLIGSLGCGLSHSLWTLVAFRMVQGIGGAFLMPVGRLLLVRTAGKKSTVKAMSTVATITLTALFLGPLIGGVLTTYVSWRCIFFINFLPGIIGLFLIHRKLPLTPHPQAGQFDFLGFILIGACVGTLLFLLDTSIEPNISHLFQCLMLSVVILCGLAYFWHAKKHDHVLLDSAVFKDRLFTIALSGSFLVRLALSTPPFLVPLMLQTGYHLNAAQSGLFSIPVLVGALISKRALNPILNRFGYRRMLTINTLISFIIMNSLSYFAFHFSPVLLAIEQFLFGIAASSQFTIMNSMAYRHLHEPHVSKGTSIYSAVVQLSACFGIAIAAATMMNTMHYHVADIYHIPLGAFKMIFLLQSIYLLGAAILFFQVGSKEGKETKKAIA